MRPTDMAARVKDAWMLAAKLSYLVQELKTAQPRGEESREAAAQAHRASVTLESWLNKLRQLVAAGESLSHKGDL